MTIPAIPEPRATKGRDYTWLMIRTKKAMDILASEIDYYIETPFEDDSQPFPIDYQGDSGIFQDDHGDYTSMAMDSIKFAERWLSHEGEEMIPDWTLGRIRDFADNIAKWEIDSGDYFMDIRDQFTDSIPDEILDYIDHHGAC